MCIGVLALGIGANAAIFSSTVILNVQFFVTWIVRLALNIKTS